MVTSYRERSNVGPERIFYKPSGGFTITIDMRDGMFNARMTEDEECKCQTEENETNCEVLEGDLGEIRKKISEIDRELGEIEQKRNALLMQRNEVIESYYNKRREAMDYAHRNMLYELLNNPAMDGSTLSRELGKNEAAVLEMMNELMRIMRE